MASTNKRCGVKFKPDLSVSIAGIKLKNPVVTASGTFGYGDEILDLVQVLRIGAVITKTVTLRPKMGNPPPRLAETASGMLNSIGLQNMGVQKFIEQKSGLLRKLPVPVIVSIAGETAQEYSEISKQLTDTEGFASGIELNLSCPNLEKNIIAQDPRLVSEIVAGVKKATTLPVIAKLSPQVASIALIARSAEDSGADALSVANTFPGMAIDINTWKPKLANNVGGLSGPAIKPLALRCVWEVYRNVRIPIIGGGGIMTAADAVEFLLAGASAISVGTASFIDPEAPAVIAGGIKEYMQSKKLAALSDITGKVIS